MERRKILLGLGGIVLAGLAAPAVALPLDDGIADDPYWQCVPVARTMSGIQIYGDAHTWWDQAEGRYRKGSEPKKGAVLNFMPHGGMKLGHVAAVTKILDDRTILVTHSNWSPYGGRRGYVEKNVRVVDVSENNDWSRVRVWFAPIANMGGNEWPTFGFIYPNGRPPMALPETAMELPKEPPQLRMAVREDPEEDFRPTSRMLDIRKALFEPRPTGRLAYLDRTLKRLK